MSQDLHFISIEVQSHLYPGLQIRILTPCGASPPSKSWHSRLTFINVSSPFRSQELHFSSIQVSPHPTQVSRYAPPLHLDSISPQSRSQYPFLTSIHILTHLHPGPDICISPPHTSCLTSIQARNCISAPPKSHLTPIQASGYASQLHPGLSLPPLRSCELNLNFIQVPSHPQPGPRYASHLHPGHVSPPCRSGY